MKRLIIPVLAILTVASAANASDPFGVGASGGALLPVAQEDQGTGFLFGVRVYDEIKNFQSFKSLSYKYLLAFGYRPTLVIHDFAVMVLFLTIMIYLLRPSVAEQFNG